MAFLKLAAVLVWAVQVQAVTTQVDLLERHLELAHEGQVYLRLEPDQVRAFIGAMEVQSLPLGSHAGVPATPLTSARLSDLIPGIPEKLVMACSGCEDSSGTTSLQDRIGIEEMPSNFVAVLSDGTSWLVLSEAGWGPSSVITANYWRARVLISYLRSLTADGQGQLLISQMTPEAARSLYWTMQPGMGVLRADKELQMDAEHIFIFVLVTVAVVCVSVLHWMGKPSRKRR